MKRDGTLSNVDIERIVKVLHIHDFIGVFSKDQLPDPIEKGFYIINLENAYNKKGKPLPGSHWVLLNVRAGDSVYVDPFGVEPPVEVVKASIKPLHWNTREIQSLDSDLCGEYALMIMYQRQQGRRYEDILKDFYAYPKSTLNRNLVDKFFGIKAK